MKIFIVLVIISAFIVGSVSVAAEDWKLVAKQNELAAVQQELKATQLEMQILTEAYKRDQARIPVLQKKIKDIQGEIDKLIPKEAGKKK